MTIEFGVVDHIDRQDTQPVHATYDSRLDLIRRYDEAGFRTFHITEHHFTPLGLAPSPLIFLAAASRLTTRIRFAPLVLIYTLYNPLRLASEIAMVDHLTHGRLEIGGGRGISPYELAFYNVSHLEAPAMFKEAAEVVMMALTEDTVTYKGDYFKFFGVPIEMKTLQQPHPPLWTASGSPEGAAAAAKRNMNIVFLATGTQARILVDSYKEAWEKAHGGSGKTMPLIGLSRHLYVGDTDQQAEERGLFAFGGWYNRFTHLWRRYDRTGAHSAGATGDRVTGMVTGTAETVREKVAAELEATGANYLVTRFAYGELDHAESVASLERFTDGVMPHFRPVPAEARRAAS